MWYAQVTPLGATQQEKRWVLVHHLDFPPPQAAPDNVPSLWAFPSWGGVGCLGGWRNFGHPPGGIGTNASGWDAAAVQLDASHPLPSQALGISQLLFQMIR